MKREYKKLILILATWQGAVLLFFLLALTFLPLQRNFLGGSVHFVESPLLWSHANYDGEHYIEVAQFGYGPLRYFFFPLYPIILRFVSHYLLFLNFPLVWSGIIVSGVSFLAGMFVFYKLLRIDYSEKISFRAVLLLLVFPSSFYLTSVYTESLFLLLCVSCFYFARKRNWLAAGVIGIFASLTRLVGVVLVASIFIEWYLEYRREKTNLISLVPVLCIPLGLLFYSFYLYRFIGDPLAFFHNITTYGGQRSDHLVVLPQVFYRYVFKILPNLNGYLPLILTTLFEFISGTIFLILSAISFFKLKVSYALFLLLGYLVPTFSGSFSSLPRYVLILFPAFIVMSLYLERLPKKVTIIAYGVSCTLLSVFTAMYAVGFWVS